ncbi:MAG: HAD family phosphatase [Chloroflexota bacterium]|nr:HAD family phosphatase [Chloroflexota bacterium]
MPPPLERPAAVIFDLDGTLVDTVETRIAAWLSVFDEWQLPATRELVAPLIGADGKRLAREVATRAGKTLDNAQAEAIDRRSGEIYETLNTNPRPLPGGKELIQALEQRGIPWAIATSSRRDQVVTSIAALALPREPRIVDGSAVEHAKPAPDLLLLAARQLGVDPESCWYVGDSTADMAAALAASMVPIGVTEGSVVDAATLRAAGAQHTVATLGDLVPLLAPG